MKIEFLYFDGCPSHVGALENLKQVLESEKIETDLKLIKVISPEDATRLEFFGSPSIRINGKDLEGRDEDASFNCRIYTINGQMTGIPSINYIREKLTDIVSQ